MHSRVRKLATTRRPITPETPIAASIRATAAMPAAEKSDARTEGMPAFAVIHIDKNL
jgi:hypothetical protein